MEERNQRDDRDRARAGPFPGPGARERPWEQNETERGPFERRRPGERRAPELSAEETGSEGGNRRRRWGRRKADVLNTGAEGSLTSEARRLARRFREPLIGLTLAGVAAPLINAGVNVDEETARGSGGEAERAAGEAGVATAERADLETAVGETWAEAEEETVRASTIEGAMVRYGIGRDLAEDIYEAAERHAIEPDVAFGLVNTESTFRERAVSHVGARGLTQVMPRTAKWLDPSVNASRLFDRDTNLDLGFKYLRMMIDKYGGNVENALTAYNRGPGTVDKILKRGGNPDNGYAGKVLGG